MHVTKTRRPPAPFFARDETLEPSWVRDIKSSDYFSSEWQRVPREQDALFEHLCLLIFQNGLWWSIVLSKRQTLSHHFKNFAPRAVADITESDISRMLRDPAMIRNDAKIRSCVHNAQMLLEQGISLPLIFERAFPQPLVVAAVDELPRTCAPTDEVAAYLQGCGFQRTGPVVCCALAQAAGFIRLAPQYPAS